MCLHDSLSLLMELSSLRTFVMIKSLSFHLDLDPFLVAVVA